jgi:subtilisin-like proprotein convertase family protein
MSVDVGITHTWIGDLRLRLENVATGQQINMWNRQCGSTDNINATFIDGGLTTLCADIPPGGAQVDPTIAGLGPAFSTLDSLLAAGDWRLIVDDNFAGDTGSLNTWSLNLGVGTSVCYAYAAPQEIPTLDVKGIAALAVLLAGAAAFLLWRRRG